MPRHRSRIALLSLAAAGLLLAGVGDPGLRAVRAAEGPTAGAPELPPEVEYDQKLRSARVTAGREFESCGTFALSNKLPKTALDIFKRVLEFDPDNQRARRELGFDKKGTEWVAVAAKQEKLANIYDINENKRGDLEKRVTEAEKRAAQAFVAAGVFAKSKGLTENAAEMWKLAFDLDYQEPTANRELGHTLKDGVWLTPRKIAHLEYKAAYDKALTNARNLQVAVKPADQPTGLGAAAGLDFKSLRTENFQVESNLPEPDIRETLIWCERARRFYCDLFDIQDRLVNYSGRPYTTIVCKKDEELHKLIDVSPEIPADRKSFFKKNFASVPSGSNRISRFPDGETAKREIVHSVTHILARDTIGTHAPWLSDAIANSVAGAIRESDLKVCFAEEGSTGGIQLEHLELSKAPALLFDQVRAKKDTKLETIVKLPSDLLTAAQLAKSWSVVWFLIERDRLQARDYLAAAGQGGGRERSQDPRILAQYFEDFKTWDALDTAWRAWAIDVYRKK